MRLGTPLGFSRLQRIAGAVSAAGQRRPGQVVPDNMVVITSDPIEADSSFNYPLETTRPFWVLEYVSKNNKRKDYEDNFDRYEHELKVPYYLTFYPDDQELTLYRHTGKKYVTVKPNKHGRYAISELDLEVGLLDGRVRYWHKGELLPLPGDLQRDLEEAKRCAEEAGRRADELQRRLEEEQQARHAAERELSQLRARVAPAKNNGNALKSKKTDNLP